MVRCAVLAWPPGDWSAAIPLRAEDSNPSRRPQHDRPRPLKFTPEFTSRTIALEPFPPTNRYHNRYHK